MNKGKEVAPSSADEVAPSSAGELTREGAGEVAGELMSEGAGEVAPSNMNEAAPNNVHETAQVLSKLTHTPEETKQLAATLAPLLRAGDVILLEGDLGAGKTHFVQGLAAALGVSTPVTSPTFNILLEYHEGKLPLYHFDLYRLDEAWQLEDIDYFSAIEGDSDGVALVEWAEKFPDEAPLDYMEIAIRVDVAAVRHVTVQAFGKRASALVDAWSHVDDALWDALLISLS